MPSNSSDLALSIAEYVHLQTMSTGKFTTNVGPTYVTASENQRYMIPSSDGRLVPVDSGDIARQAIQRFTKASRNQYVVLTHPSGSKEKPHPAVGETNEANELNFGDVQVIPGPCHFALWPGQEATVVTAHTLRSGQYLIIEVTNEAEALSNWNEDTMGTAPWNLGQEVVAENIINTSTDDDNDDDASDEEPVVQDESTLENYVPIQGKQYIITGQSISFFIPVTGIQVVKNKSNAYVRAALVLQQLEYCVLISETGEKTVVRGPGIVFPRNAGDTFYAHNRQTEFRPIELGGQRMGIYVKALVSFTDETGKEWKAGQEGFITGEDMPFFYPDERLDIIMYGDKLVLYAVTVEAGKAYYLLNRDTGLIELVEGPDMLLPNPVEQVFIERPLGANEIALWYPNSKVAQPDIRRRDFDEYDESIRTRSRYDEAQVDTTAPELVRKGGFEALVAFSTERDKTFSKPRIISIGDEVPQAPHLQIWQNYAILIQNAANETRHMVGPLGTFLQYDESPVTFIKPNGSSDSDVYLQLRNNTWTFTIEATTADGVSVVLELVSKINFVGDPSSKWWNIENPWKMVLQDFQSQIIPYVAATQLENLITPDGYANMLSQVMTTTEDEQQPILIAANSMQIERVYISSFTVADRDIQHQLEQARAAMVKLDLAHASASEEAGTIVKIAELTKTIVAQKAIILAEETGFSEQEARAAQEVIDIVAELARTRQLKQAATEKQIAEGQNELEIQMLKEQTDAMVKRLEAIAPHDSAYLRQVVGGQLLGQFADVFGGSAQRAGVPLMEYVSSILKGTEYESLLGLFQMPEIESKDD